MPTGIRIVRPRLTWTPHPNPKIAANLERVLREWEDTPYESGQRLKGLAADCIGGVFGVVDELDGRPRAQHAGMPNDTAMHNRATAIAAMRELVRRYQPAIKVEGREVQPGDIVVTGMIGGGPGHVEMVGPRKNELWHCVPSSGFHQGGWGLFAEQVLWAVYRITDQERWR